jgi:CheY-like chemotaxis protein
MTVYLVDEDASAFRAWIAELESRGMSTQTFWNADDAYEMLSVATEGGLSLVLVDVMLAVEDASTSRFSVERTDSYLETGLRLVEDLASANPAVFPARAVLLTNSTSEGTLRAARRTGEMLDVPLWLKSTFLSPRDFGDAVERRMQVLGLRR